MSSRTIVAAADGSRTAIDRALILYAELRSADRAMRLSDLSRRTGLAKSTTHRMLSALMAAGMVVRFGVGYSAAHRAVGPGEAGSAVARQRGLLRRLAPFVGDLRGRTGLTSSLAVVEGSDAVFLHRVHGHHDVWTPSDDSGRACAYRTAAGRLLLSHDLRTACDVVAAWGIAADEAAELNRDLMQIRHRGFAVAERGDVTCLAVGMQSRLDQPRIALTVRGRKHLIDRDRALFWLRNVSHAAAKALFSASADLPGSNTADVW